MKFWDLLKGAKTSLDARQFFSIFIILIFFFFKKSFLSTYLGFAINYSYFRILPEDSEYLSLKGV